jgi:hypothetical protein
MEEIPWSGYHEHGADDEQQSEVEVFDRERSDGAALVGLGYVRVERPTALGATRRGEMVEDIVTTEAPAVRVVRSGSRWFRHRALPSVCCAVCGERRIIHRAPGDALVQDGAHS